MKKSYSGCGRIRSGQGRVGKRKINFLVQLGISYLRLFEVVGCAKGISNNKRNAYFINIYLIEIIV